MQDIELRVFLHHSGVAAKTPLLPFIVNMGGAFWLRQCRPQGFHRKLKIDSTFEDTEPHVTLRRPLTKPGNHVLRGLQGKSLVALEGKKRC